MLCPVCAKDMLVLEFELIEIDYCQQCGGVWLDSGELELLGKQAGILHGELLAALEEHQGRAERGSKRRCPVCRGRMREVSTAGESPIILDRCPDRHGLWFDHGELQAVVKAAGADEGNVLARFLADLEANWQRTKGTQREEVGR